MICVQNISWVMIKLKNHIPAVVVPEEGQDLLEGFVLGLGHFLVGEYPEDGQENAKRQEGIVFQGSLKSKNIIS